MGMSVNCLNTSSRTSPRGVFLSTAVPPAGGVACIELVTQAASGSRNASRRALRAGRNGVAAAGRSEEHPSELQTLMRVSYAVFCLNKQQHAHPHTPATQ